MPIVLLSLFAVSLVTLASFIAILVNDWRITIGSLAAQYAGVFLLVGIEWPLALSVTTLIAGWLSGVILGMAMISLPKNLSTAAQRKILGRRSNPLFNFLAALLIYLTVLSQASQLQYWLPGIRFEQSSGCFDFDWNRNVTAGPGSQTAFYNCSSAGIAFRF